MIKKIIVSLLIVLFVTSCVPRKKIVYMNDIENSKTTNNILTYEVKLQPDDLLSIIVSAENLELTIPFNMPQIQGNLGSAGSQANIKTYLIDNEGFIDYPVVGKIKLAGLTKAEANRAVVSKISDYFKMPPSVNLSITNFKISVIGEVKNPGSYPVTGTRITLIEALSIAGDLTIYGNRNNVLVIRETNGQKTFNRIDLTNSSFIDSPYYYLSQNDVVYVEPNKVIINNSAIGSNLSLAISASSVLLTILILVFKKQL